MTTLEDLYYGNIVPYEHSFKRGSEYSAQVEHPDRFELNSLTAKTEQSSRRD